MRQSKAPRNGQTERSNQKDSTSQNDEERATLINEYNSMIMGMHNYFQIATCVSSDFADMGREVDVVKLSQLKRKALSAKEITKDFRSLKRNTEKANKSDSIVANL